MSSQKEILIFESAFTLTNFLVKKWTALAQQSIRDKGRFAIALSGGKSPLEFFCRLSNIKDFELWHKTHIFLVDERFVALDHPESNYGFLQEHLCHDIPIPKENIHPVLTEGYSLEEAANQYEQELRKFFNLKEGQFPEFDFILLGLGEDGHTASLFPNNENLFERQRLSAPVSYGHQSSRITLTLPVLNNARETVFLVIGKNKADVVHQLIEEKKDLPAAKIIPVHGQLTFLLDKEAARKISFKEHEFVHKDEAISITE